jgi:outer membrane protein
VRDQAILTLRENNVTVLTRDLKAAKDRFSVGEVTRTDVAQAEARRAGAVGALDLARANLKTSRAAYERVIGHPPSGLVEPRPSPQVPKTLAAATEIAARESPGVVAALYREQAARFNIEIIRGELLPTVTLEADYSRRFDSSPGSLENESSSVTGRVTVPFYTGAGAGARAAGQARTCSGCRRSEQARTEVQAQVVTAWSCSCKQLSCSGSDLASVAANRIALAGVREEGGSASARCWTCSTPSRNCSIRKSRWRPTGATGGGVLHGALDHRAAQCAGAGGGRADLRPRAALSGGAQQVVRHLHHPR